MTLQTVTKDLATAVTKVEIARMKLHILQRYALTIGARELLQEAIDSLDAALGGPPKLPTVLRYRRGTYLMGGWLPPIVEKQK